MNHNGPGQGSTLPVSRRDQGAMSEERGTTRRGHRSRRGLRRPRTGTVVATVLAVALGGYGWAATRGPGYTTDHLEANDGTALGDQRPRRPLRAAQRPRRPPRRGPGAGRGPQPDLPARRRAVRLVGAHPRPDHRQRRPRRRARRHARHRPGRLGAASAPLAVGGSTSAVVDTETGEVRAATSTTPAVAAVDGLSPEAKATTRVPIAPDVTGGALAADVEVDPDGTAYAAGSGGRLVTLTPTGDGRFATTSASLGGALQDVHVLVTDDGPVVLDTVAGVLARPGGARIALTGESVTDGVPQVRPTGGSVLVATPQALLSVDLRTGATRRLTGGGTGPAAAPVVLDGCPYAVWSGSPGRVVKACGDAAPEPVVLDRATALLSPHLRLNHRSVALNDSTTGAVWSLDDGRRLDDWSSVAPPSTQTPPKDDEQTTTVDRSSKPPTARDDEVGARPGRTSVLHVLDNDVNPSGSVLSITRVSTLPAATGTLDISPDGQTVQLGLTPTATSAAFDYVIDDGRGNSSSARVTVTVRARPRTVRPRCDPG